MKRKIISNFKVVIGEDEALAPDGRCTLIFFELSLINTKCREKERKYTATGESRRELGFFLQRESFSQSLQIQMHPCFLGLHLCCCGLSGC